AGPLGVGAGGERGGLLVPHLDEADPVLARAQRLHDAVDAVAGDAEDGIDVPVDQRLDQDVRGGGGCHPVAPSLPGEGPGGAAALPLTCPDADAFRGRLPRIGEGAAGTGRGRAGCGPGAVSTDDGSSSGAFCRTVCQMAALTRVAPKRPQYISR